MLNLPKLIGHRGVKNLSPENTIESINLAKKLGLHWVELDVKISKDLIPIIFHDDSLERTTNGKGLPVDFYYRDLKKLDAGSHLYKKRTKIYIPTLQPFKIRMKSTYLMEEKWKDWKWGCWKGRKTTKHSLTHYLLCWGTLPQPTFKWPAHI